MKCWPKRVDVANDVHDRARPVKKQARHCPWMGARMCHGKCFPGRTQAASRGCCPSLRGPLSPGTRCILYQLYAPFFTLEDFSPDQRVRLGRGHQARVAALTPKPLVTVSQGLDLAKSSLGPVVFGPFETDWRCYGHRDLSDSSQRSDFTCTSHKCH